MGLVGEALFGKVQDDDINGQIETKKHQKNKTRKGFLSLMSSVFPVVFLKTSPNLLGFLFFSLSSPPGFSMLWQMRPQGGSFSQALVWNRASDRERSGGGGRRQRRRKEGRNGEKKAAEIIFTPSRPPPPTPPESITRATLLTLGRPTLFWSINAHPAP